MTREIEWGPHTFSSKSLHQGISKRSPFKLSALYIDLIVDLVDGDLKARNALAPLRQTLRIHLDDVDPIAMNSEHSGIRYESFEEVLSFKPCRRYSELYS